LTKLAKPFMFQTHQY